MLLLALPLMLFPFFGSSERILAACPTFFSLTIEQSRVVVAHQQDSLFMFGGGGGSTTEDQVSLSTRIRLPSNRCHTLDSVTLHAHLASFCPPGHSD